MEAAQGRRRLEQLERIRLAEWEARTTCSFIAAQAGMWMGLKEGEKNPMLEAALAISIMGNEKTPEEIELDAMRGPKVADRLEDDPRFRPQKEDRTALVKMNDGSELPRWLVEGDDAAAVNQNNSFEALMGGWARHPSHGHAFDVTAAKEGLVKRS